MSYDDNNIFAKILRGEFDCVKVYEDENVLSFMDVMPQVEGHTLVVPKEPAETLLELSDAAAADCIRAVKKIMAAVVQAMDVSGATLLQLNGAEVGQTVPHIHFHIIPGSILGAKGHAREMVDPATLQPLADRIIQQL